MDIELAIFPYKTRLVGLAAILIAAFLAYLYLADFRPEWMTVPVFAITSAYLETRYFVFAQTNLLDELAAILFIVGIVAFSFSKTKNEKPEYNLYRTKSLVNSIFITLGFWILSLLFIYGIAIFLVSSAIFILYFINYNLLFYFYILRLKKQEQSQIKN